MNPTPTPNSTAPVDIARIRELYHNAVDGPISIRVSNAFRSNGEMLASFAFRSEAILYAALRNDAPALLDEVERLRADCAEMRLAIKWVVSDYDEDGNVTGGVVESCRIAIEDKETKITGMEGTCAARLDALTEIEAERDKLREEVERLRETVKYWGNIFTELHRIFPWLKSDDNSPGSTVTAARKAVAERAQFLIERDSLRQQNEQLLKEIEELKANQKESQ